MNEEFEKWVSSPPIDASIERKGNESMWPGQYEKYSVQLASEAWEYQQAKIDEKEKELHALRSFALESLHGLAKELFSDIKFDASYDAQGIFILLKKHGLVDEDGNQTPLLNCEYASLDSVEKKECPITGEYLYFKKGE